MAGVLSVFLAPFVKGEGLVSKVVAFIEQHGFIASRHILYGFECSSFD